MLRGLFLEDEVCDLCGNQLRHPNLVAFKDTMEVEEKGSITVYLITEPVRPLQMVLEDINLSGEHRSDVLSLYPTIIMEFVVFVIYTMSFFVPESFPPELRIKLEGRCPKILSL